MSIIFISHSSKDNALIKDLQILEALKKAGFESVFLDFDEEKGIKLGEDWKNKLYTKIKKSHFVVLLLSPNWIKSKWCFAEYTIAEVLGKTIIPIIIDNPDNEVFNWVANNLQQVDISQNQNAINTLITRLKELTIKKQRGYSLKGVDSPYPGLMSFDIKDAAIFFGRENESERIINKLNDSDFYLDKKAYHIIAASGLGKSSLLKAGVLAYMKHFQKEKWTILPVMTPGDNPIVSFISVFASFFNDISLIQPAKNGLLSENYKDYITVLYEKLRAKTQNKILLPIDQLEEIFSMSDEKNANRFLEILQEFLNKRGVYLITTLRADFLPNFQKNKNASFLFENGISDTSLGFLSEQGIIDIIKKPAELFGIDVTQGLIERLRKDMKDVSALPLLAFTLQKLYFKMPKEQKTIDEELYKSLSPNSNNPMLTLLDNEADKAYEKSLKILNEEEIKKIFVRELITISLDEKISKKILQRNKLNDNQEKALEPFVNKRILIKDNKTISIIHESLTEAWKKLQNWLREDKEALLAKKKLEYDFINWKNHNKEKKYLLFGANLENANKYLTKYPDLFDEEEKEYIKQSIKAKEKEEKNKLLTRRALLFSAVSSFGLAIFSGFKWFEVEETKKNLQKSNLKLKEEINKAKTNLGIAMYNEAKVLRNEKIFSAANLYAYKALNLIDDKYDKFNFKEKARSLIQNFPYISTAYIIKNSFPVYSVAISPDGKYIASNSGKTIKIWDVSSGKCTKILSGHKNSIWSICYSPDGKYIASGSDDKTIRIWDVSSGEYKELIGHKNWISSVSYSPDGKYIASGSYDMTIRIWDISTGKYKTLIGHKGAIYSVSYSPDGKYIASGSSDKTVKIWDVSTGEYKILIGHEYSVLSVSYSPDGKYLASGSQDKTIRIWDVKSGRYIKILTKHNGPVISVNYSPNGKYIVSGSSDKTVKIWDVSTGQYIKTLTGHKNVIYSVNYSHNGKYIVSGSKDKMIKIWDLSNGQYIKTLVISSKIDMHINIDYSPDGKYLASGSGTIRIWDVNSGKCIKTLIGHKDDVNSVSYSPDGKYIASGSYGGTIRIWDVSSGKCKELIGHKEPVVSVCYSPDGKYIASGSWDKTIKIWNVSTGKCKTLIGHKNWISSVSYSPDGKYIASGSHDKTIRIWDVSSGKCTKTLYGHKGDVNSVSYSPDGKYIASGSDDGTIRIWDVSSGKYKELIGHKEPVVSVCYSPDGKYIASGSYDETIRIWDVSSGKCIQITTKNNYYGNPNIGYFSKKKYIEYIFDEPTSISYSPDGKFIAFGSIVQTIKIIKLIKFDKQTIQKEIHSLEKQLQKKFDGVILRDANIPFTKPMWSKNSPYYWMDKAEKGDVVAMYNLGLIYDRDNENKKALYWYEKAAQKGYKPAFERIKILKEWMRNNNIKL